MIENESEIERGSRKGGSSRRRWLFPVLITGIVLAALLPFQIRSYLDPRELPKRLLACSNLRAIGQVLHEYGIQNDGQRPSDLSLLVEQGFLEPDILRNPFEPGSTDQCDLFFVLDFPDPIQTGYIAAYLPLKGRKTEGGAILFADGHAEYLPAPKFTEAIEKFKRDYKQAHAVPPRILIPE